jgi:hypothetical protein
MSKRSESKNSLFRFGNYRKFRSTKFLTKNASCHVNRMRELTENSTKGLRKIPKNPKNSQKVIFLKIRKTQEKSVKNDTRSPIYKKMKF